MQQVDRSAYYRLLDDLAALGRLRRLREQKRAIQEKNNQLIQQEEKRSEQSEEK
jgi:hypothetical protein